MKLNNSTIQLASQSSIDTLNTEVNNLKSSVSNGKSLIAAAVTDKGVPTAASDSFTTMSNNIRNIETVETSLNIFCQITQPSVQNGLWIKRNPSEIDKILFKSGYYLSDGTARLMPGTASGVSVQYYYRSIGIKIDNIIYIIFLDYLNQKLLKYDLTNNKYEVGTNCFSNLSTSYNYSAWCTKNNKIYFVVRSNLSNQMRSIIEFDPITETWNNILTITVSSNILDEIYGLYLTDEYAYIAGGKVKGNASSGQYWYEQLVKVNLTTKEQIILLDVKLTGPGRTGGIFYEYSNKLYYTKSCSIMYSYDYIRDEIELINKILLPNVSSVYNISSNTIFYLLGKVYYVGIGTSETLYGAARNVLVYDVATDSVNVLENIIGEEYARSAMYYGGIDFQDTAQIGVFGGSNQTSSSSRGDVMYNMYVFNVKTNEFENKTIVCNPVLGNKSTVLYESNNLVLEYGFNEVYYQSVDGLKKQDAAIIKNGTVINI